MADCILVGGHQHLCSTRKMKVAGYCNTSLINCETVHIVNSEDHSMNFHCFGNLRS